MKNPKLKPELLTEEQRTALENFEAQQKQLTVLQDIADMTQDMLMEGDKEKKSNQKAIDDMGALLMDIRESLKGLEDKKTPESPDYSKPIVEAVSKLEKALKTIEVKPSVNVSSPDVKIPPVDLREFNQLLRTEIPKAFDKAIKQIVIPEIPETDNSELLKAWEGISEQLVSIETATRMKPLPGSMSINNLDEITTVIQQSGTLYKLKVDKSTTTDVIYIGKALPGTATSDSAWLIKKVDKTVTDNIAVSYANSGEFTAVYDNRASLTYN